MPPKSARYFLEVDVTSEETECHYSSSGRANHKYGSACAKYRVTQSRTASSSGVKGAV
jgi:hypothetical protein